MVRISGLWSGSGLFCEKWSGNGPDFELLGFKPTSLLLLLLAMTINRRGSQVYGLFTKVQKCKIESGFSLVFLIFWSGFSLV